MTCVDCLRLFGLYFWLLACGVNCVNSKRVGYAVRVQAGQYPTGVHNDNRDYERWMESPILRRNKAGYKTSNMDEGQSGNVYAAQEDHATDAKSLPIQIRHPSPVIPETQHGSVPLTSHFNSGLSSGSDTQEQSSVMYNHFANKAATFPGGRRIHQANSDSFTSTGSVQFPSTIYRAKSKSKGSFSPVPADKAPMGFGPNNRKSPIYSHSSRAGPNKAVNIHASSSRPNLHPLHRSPLKTRTELSLYRPTYIFPKSFTHTRTNPLPDVLKPTDSILKGHSPGSNPAVIAQTQTPYPPWRPRVYSGDVPPEPRGYAHVRHLKPSSDQPHPQVSSAAGRKFLETGFASVNQNPSSYTHSNNNNVRGRQSSNWHPAPPDRAQIHVQGKFKPFQRLDTSSDSSTTANSTASEPASQTTPPPSSTLTGNTSTVAPSASGELTTKLSLLILEHAKDAKPVLQASYMEGKSNSSTGD